jgi:hypothetical protein
MLHQNNEQRFIQSVGICGHISEFWSSPISYCPGNNGNSGFGAELMLFPTCFGIALHFGGLDTAFFHHKIR